MKFQPKDEQTLEREKAELASKRLMKYGTICDCEVVDAENKVSSKHNEMIKLVLRVFTPDAEEKIFDDYLLASMEYKLRHAADTFGLLDKYEAGILMASDFFNKTGKCKMGIEKDKTGQYPDKNKIVDYVKRGVGMAMPTTLPSKESVATGALPIDDEIPF